MILLSPSQSAAADRILAILNNRGSLCIVPSEPGFGLTTCLESVRSRIHTPSIVIADHPKLAGLDLLGQLYHQLNLDFEFQAKNGFPGFAAEIANLRGISTIFVDDVDKFFSCESAKRLTLKQLKWILIAAPNVNMVVSGVNNELPDMLQLHAVSPHALEVVHLRSFHDFNEYRVFFASVLSKHPKSGMPSVSMETLYVTTCGNLHETFLRLFHPAYVYRGQEV